MLRYLLLKIIFFALVFLNIQLFVIFILYNLNLICHCNYVSILFKDFCLFKILLAVNSDDCILKGSKENKGIERDTEGVGWDMSLYWTI